MHIWRKRDDNQTEGSRKKMLKRTTAVTPIIERNGAEDDARPGGDRAIKEIELSVR